LQDPGAENAPGADGTAPDSVSASSRIDFDASRAAWADSGAALVYVAKDSAATDQLVWVHAETGETRRLTDADGPMRNLVYDPREHRLLYLSDGDVLGVALDADTSSASINPPAPDTVLAPSRPIYGFDVHPDGGLVVAVRPPSRGGSGAVLWHRADAPTDTLTYWTGGDSYILNVRTPPSGNYVLERHAIEKSWYTVTRLRGGLDETLSQELTHVGFTGAPNWVTGAWSVDEVAATPGVLFSLGKIDVRDVVACEDGKRPTVRASHQLHPIRVMPDGRRLMVAEAAPALCQAVEPNLMSTAYLQRVDSLRRRGEIHAIYGSPGRDGEPRLLYDASMVAGFVGGAGPPDRVAFVAIDSTRTSVDYRSFAVKGEAATLFVADLGRDLTLDAVRVVGRNVDLETDGFREDPPNSARDTAIWVPVTGSAPSH
jgi:hypothetical protein